VTQTVRRDAEVSSLEGGCKHTGKGLCGRPGFVGRDVRLSGGAERKRMANEDGAKHGAEKREAGSGPGQKKGRSGGGNDDGW